MGSNRLPPEDLTPFPEPDQVPWTFTFTPGRMPRTPIAAIAVVAAGFFYSLDRCVAHGGLGEGVLALIALALVLHALIKVSSYASTDEAGRKRPPQPRSRSPNAGAP